MPKGNIELHTDLLQAWEALNDAECGRLVRSMLVYRLTGETMRLSGNERSLFCGEKMKIDRQIEAEKKKKTKTKERVTRYRALHSVTGRYNALHSVTHPSPSSPPASSPPSSPPILPLLSPVSPSPVSSPSPKEKHSPSESAKRKRPMPPTLEDVAAYCLERENGIDPEAFLDFYTANGWKQGKGKPIVDWKAAVRTWEKNRKPKRSGGNIFMEMLREEEKHGQG